jgi:hypothetical protein
MKYIWQMIQQYLFNNKVCSLFKFKKMFLILFAKKHSFGKLINNNFFTIEFDLIWSFFFF